MTSLVDAVRRGDAAEVEVLLEAGADPETLDGTDGLPLLCLAVAAYDEEVARALLSAGADRLRALPDGSTPLSRAVDGGSVGMTLTLVLDPGPVEDPVVRDDLLARARHWTDVGAEDGLRRRTGATGPVGRVRVEDREWSCDYEQFTLGGLSVRDGHAGVLSELEARFGLRAPFEELCARALALPDQGHAVWTTARSVLGRRMDEETWAAAAALGRHPDRLHRLFAADVFLSLVMGECVVSPDAPVTWRHPFEGRAAGHLLPWAAEERDPEVLAALLIALFEDEDDSAEVEALGLSCRMHPDSRVRVMALGALRQGPDRLLVRPEQLAVVLELARDPDPDVRAAVCGWLSEYPGRDPGIADALFELTHEDGQLTRIHAVHGLAERDDPRCVEAARRIGPVDLAGWPDTWVLDSVQRYEKRQQLRLTNT